MKNKQVLTLKTMTCWMIIFILFLDLIITPVPSSAKMIHTQQTKINTIVNAIIGNSNEKEATDETELENEVEIKTLSIGSPERLGLEYFHTKDIEDDKNIKLMDKSNDERVDDPTEVSQVSSNGYWTTLSPEEQESLLNLDQYEADFLYNSEPVMTDDKNFELTVKLVFGEAGFEDFAGKCLVAQAIRDTYLSERNAGNMEFFDLKEIKKEYKYAGKINHSQGFYDRFSKEYQECVDAVTYILKNGQSAVNHRIVFFYAPKHTQSRFHETQDFVIEHGGHRFFDNVNWQ